MTTSKPKALQLDEHGRPLNADWIDLPEEFRFVVPYANEWGIVDDDARIEYIYSSTPNHRKELLQFYFTQDLKSLGDWMMANKATFNGTPEYWALTSMMRSVDEVDISEVRNEIFELLNVPINDTKCYVLTTTPLLLQQKLQVSGKIQHMQEQEFAFELMFVQCRKIEIIQSKTTLGEKLASDARLHLRSDSRQFIFPELRSLYISTNSFELKAEYSEVELTKRG